MNYEEVRALYTKDFIRVYQAYNNSIADAAIKHNRFVSPPFKIERATWIKPSFCWMMYRAGWATKENQERILAIDITHEGFNWALEHACLSHFDPTKFTSPEEWAAKKKESPVVIQWDPERDIQLNKLDYRSLQVGLTAPVVHKYINEWIINIHDITGHCKEMHQLINNGKIDEAKSMLPEEKVYLPPVLIK